MTSNTSASDPSLRTTSISLVAGLQASSGAFPACPSFAVYQYSWLRDGTYIAHALDVCGRAAEAENLHRWVCRVVESMAPSIALVVGAAAEGRVVTHADMLPTRYTLDGGLEEDGDEGWPTAQVDGYGVWVWGLREHLAGAACPAWATGAVALVADYLTATWRVPCFDIWEEFGDRLHTASLGAVAAGLRAAADLLGRDTYRMVSDEVVRYMRERCVKGGTLVKGPSDDRVDSALLSLAVPLRVFDVDDPLMAATIDRVAAELVSSSGGVYRYLGDKYYGGGAWLLLTAWLGWCELERGDRKAAQARLAWVESHADARGWLPEQVLDESQDPTMIRPWIDKWGEPAHPLLWSHAMYLLLNDALRRA